jgi:lipase ATG15
MLPTLVTSLLVHLFSSFFTGDYRLDIASDNNNVSPPLKFELRHLHAVSSSSATVLFSDVLSPELLQTHTLSDPSGSTKATYSIHTNSIKTHRPSSFASFSNARLSSLRFGRNEWVDWEEDEILGPNVDSRETLLELAKMTSNAYLEPDEAGWYALNGTWNVVRLSPFPIYFKSNMFNPVLSFWMGTRERWVSRPRLRHI